MCLDDVLNDWFGARHAKYFRDYYNCSCSTVEEEEHHNNHWSRVLLSCALSSEVCNTDVVVGASEIMDNHAFCCMNHSFSFSFMSENNSSQPTSIFLGGGFSVNFIPKTECSTGTSYGMGALFGNSCVTILLQNDYNQDEAANICKDPERCHEKFSAQPLNNNNHTNPNIPPMGGSYYFSPDQVTHICRNITRPKDHCQTDGSATTTLTPQQVFFVDPSLHRNNAAHVSPPPPPLQNACLVLPEQFLPHYLNDCTIAENIDEWYNHHHKDNASSNARATIGFTDTFVAVPSLLVLLVLLGLHLTCT
uniref:Uncharacterized protein n=1 Tax=Amphora coffeiformis TaxID=265554 RepID=A0A7S3L554_9STRA|mmetsp:Transcript_6091/g.12207  ORF Transcript_6091/g.12207 Transcript_6091/m.12207 type:complete len:306 (-) Transcript_6091:96-1013(-)|eukprot:scaffold5479_cov199-Amphora_coffeaeformis.AAC.67